MQISVRKLAVPIVMAIVGLVVSVSPAFAQSGTSSEWTMSTVSSNTEIPLSPTTNRCVNRSHTIPCWAVTKNPGVGNQGCPRNSPVPLFLRSGGVSCIRSGELVEITCFFQGDPVVAGDNFQDHVIQEDGGGRADPGHIPDAFIDLDGHTPNNLPFPPSIPGC